MSSPTTSSSTPTTAATTGQHRYVQAKPATGTVSPPVTRTSEGAGGEHATPAPTLRAIPFSHLALDSDALLAWLVRYPVERNHPRETTGTIHLWKAAGEVATVQHDERLQRVMRKLVTEGFLSMPVLDDRHRYIGFIDMLDLVWHTCTAFRAWQEETGQVYPVPEEQHLRRGWATFFELDRFKNSTVDDIIRLRPNTETRIPFHPVYRGFSLFHVIELMARVGVHRVPVIHPDGRVAGIITQSMVISLLDQNLHRLGTTGRAHVRDMLDMLYPELISVQASSLAIDAFKTMVTRNINGLPVLDDRGALVDNISVRDLRGIGTQAEHFERLWHRVDHFKRETRETFKQQTPEKPITVQASDTLETVIRRMDDGNIHRVFVVEYRSEAPDAPIPTHCISQRDVLRFLLYRVGLEPAPYVL